MSLSETLKKGPIVIIEDDIDEHLLLEEVFSQLKTPNQRIYFTKGSNVLDYLKTTNQTPFLIISDIRLQIENGIELKKQIDQNPLLREKSIPFVFMSTLPPKEIVKKAYTELTIQGVFTKPNDFNKLKDMFALLVQYWTICEHPEPSL
ncbi:response regulator [Cytophagaceae bacterium YF14B1]|uniref:Response regulator n=1 Tax=Xanthocytophaga flava TaxID=3048013 RepID=A0AAE3U522_9BACT|nr:response regulator [Xanthocytophaga flavus]MDJ1480299.1 response regulator [Xanthocytophaga flavus]